MQASHDSLAGHLIDAVNARFIARDLERSFAKHGRNVKITIDLTGEGWPHDVSVDRGRNIYKITYSASARRRFVLPARHSLLAYLYWMDSTPATVTRMTINAGDGDSPSCARFAPSAPRSKHVAIPDPHFFQHHAFQAERLRVPDTPAWETRSDQVVWRGGSNGPGQISIDHADQDNPLVVPRMRLCLKVQGDSRFDVRMVRIGADGGIWTEPARQVGLIGDHIAAASWLTRKYAIDIDGFSNTWSNFFIRMLLGCCAFQGRVPARLSSMVL